MGVGEIVFLAGLYEGHGRSMHGFVHTDVCITLKRRLGMGVRCLNSTRSSHLIRTSSVRLRLKPGGGVNTLASSGLGRSEPTNCRCVYAGRIQDILPDPTRLQYFSNIVKSTSTGSSPVPIPRRR